MQISRHLLKLFGRTYNATVFRNKDKLYTVSVLSEHFTETEIGILNNKPVNRRYLILSCNLIGCSYATKYQSADLTGEALKIRQIR